MGLTYEEADRAGIARLHPDHLGGPSAGGSAAEPVGAKPSRRPRVKVDGLGRNKTEVRFHDFLESLPTTRSVVFAGQAGSLRFWLGPRVTYTPDFIYEGRNGSLVAFDVKGGPVEDDAAAKINVAAEMFPWIGFVLAKEERRNRWLYRSVDPQRGKLPWRPFAEFVSESNR